MRIRYGIARGTYQLAKLEVDISKEAKIRQSWFEFYHNNKSNGRLTCRHFGISPQTFYRWLKRYDPQHPRTLESRSHRPCKLRQPTYSIEQIEAVRKIREEYPKWGKDKLAILLQKAGYQLSVSMVGRIITYLKSRNILREPLVNPVSARKRLHPRPYAIRKPKEYQPKLPGDLVELDTMDVRPLPGIILKHFSAYDVVSRWNVLGIYNQATAENAKRFLDDMEKRTPNQIRSIQIDGGSEFQSVFEEECRIRDIKLFVLPPRSPKLNGAVERANRTHAEEFYEIVDSSFDLADLRPKLLQWEITCNTVRPNQALHYLTPFQSIEQLFREVRCH
jgi:putative transposase